MILLDTHAAVWFAAGIKLKPAAMRSIGTNSANGTLLLSAISAWEIGMLVAKGRLVLTQPVETYIRALFTRAGIIEEPVSARIGDLAARLPGDFHGDPADRLIVASAVYRSAGIVTRDQRILRYAKETRFVSALAC